MRNAIEERLSVQTAAKIATMCLLMGLLACQTLGASRTPLTASLRADSSEIVVDFRMNAYVAKIGFTLLNNTGGPISKAGCGGPGWPMLEKNVSGHWVAAYYPIYLACRIIPDFALEKGATYRGLLDFMAFEPGHNMGPELEVDSIDGIYRLHWTFTEGRDGQAKRARAVEAISNEFRMSLRQNPSNR